MNDSIIQLINYEGVCRTAPATPGLLKTVKYLGYTINSDGTNMTDIEQKCNRGIGIINKIQTIHKTMFFGRYHFETGKTMIDSMLLGSILNNSEVAYNLTRKLHSSHGVTVKNTAGAPK